MEEMIQRAGAADPDLLTQVPFTKIVIEIANEVPFREEITPVIRNTFNF
jgi:hypothetical protein